MLINLTNDTHYRHTSRDSGNQINQMEPVIWCLVGSRAADFNTEVNVGLVPDTVATCVEAGEWSVCLMTVCNVV